MSLVRRLFPFARRASTAAASTPAQTTPVAPQPEVIPSVEELRTRARKVYKEVSTRQLKGDIMY
jgi:hypothetical protein